MTLTALVVRLLADVEEALTQPDQPVAPAPAPPANAPKDAFEAALEFTLEHEGGYVNDPADPGGRTKYGISARAHPEAWAHGEPSMDDAKAIYRHAYWDAVQGDQLPPRTAIACFDLAVHSGPGIAARFLQKAAGASEDGKIGPATIEAAHRAGDDVAQALRVIDLRVSLVSGLIQGKPANYLRDTGGFMRRLVDLTALVCRF